MEQENIIRKSLGMLYTTRISVDSVINQLNTMSMNTDMSTRLALIKKCDREMIKDTCQDLHEFYSVIKRSLDTTIDRYESKLSELNKAIADYNDSKNFQA